MDERQPTALPELNSSMAPNNIGAPFPGRAATYTPIEVEALLQFGDPPGISEETLTRMKEGEPVSVGTVSHWSEPTTRMRPVGRQHHRITF